MMKWNLSSVMAIFLSIAVVKPCIAQAPIRYQAKSIAECFEWMDDPVDPDDPDDSGFVRARKALGPEGPFLKLAIPALIEALGEKKTQKDLIIWILADHGPDAVPGLLAALRRPDELIRIGATKTLTSIRPRTPEMYAALFSALDDSASEVRTAAAEGLRHIRRDSKIVVPQLLARIGHSDPLTRAEIIRSLGRLARTPGPATKAIVAALRDPDEKVRAVAADTLSDTSPIVAKAVASDVIENLKNTQDEYVQFNLADMLVKAGPAAAPAVPQLTEMLKSSNHLSVMAAAWALGEIGNDAKSAVPHLLEITKSEDHQVRYCVFQALGNIGPAAKSAIPLCTAMLQADATDSERMNAAITLGGIGPDALAVVPALVSIARDRTNSGNLREFAVKAVARIDPATAKKEKLEFAHLDIRLGEVPKITLKPTPAVTAEQAARIKSLIAALAETNTADTGLSAVMSGTAFAPFPERARYHGGLLIAERRGPTDAFRKLVEIGPDALPFLLSALDDRTPTQMKFHCAPGSQCFVGGYMPEGNPLNMKEMNALNLKQGEKEDEDDDLLLYKVKVGDVCFVAIGQIVNRPYAAVHYIPSGIVGINSVSQSRFTQEQLRAAWGGPDPAKVLMNSLLTDFATEGVCSDGSFQGLGDGTEYQTEAAVRLMYYFPDDAGPLIAARLKGLDVSNPVDHDAWIQREIHNRVGTDEFIKALNWVKTGPVRDALAEIARRTNDPVIRRALTSGK